MLTAFVKFVRHSEFLTLFACNNMYQLPDYCPLQLFGSSNMVPCTGGVKKQWKIPIIISSAANGNGCCVKVRLKSLFGNVTTLMAFDAV